MKGVIFDMDGTMVDNMMVHHRAWQKQLAALGREMSIDKIKETIHGVNEEIVEKLFGNQYSAAQRQRISQEKEQAYREIFKNQLRLVPGLQALFDQLQEARVPLAIGTAAPPENVDFVLDNLNIRHLFGSVLHSMNVTKGKPHPEVFLRSAENLGVPIEECLVFEDSVVGAETALNAGCPVIIINTTHSPEEFRHFPHVVKFIDNYQGLDLEDIKALI